MLQYINPVVIKANPDRPNTFFVNIMRLTNIDKNLDTIIDPLCNELKEKKGTFLCDYSLCWKPWIFRLRLAIREIRNEGKYHGEHVPENRIFDKFHKDYTDAIKTPCHNRAEEWKTHITFSICNSCTCDGLRCLMYYKDNTL